MGKIWATTTLASVLVLAMAACARFEPRSLSPAQTASDFEKRSLDNPKLKEFLETNLNRKFSAWPATSWDFSMLTLAALYYHPELDVARAQWQVAQAAIITAGAIPNPTVGAAPGFTANPIGGVSPLLYGFFLDNPIETAGKRGYRLDKATHLSSAARLNIAVTAWQVRSRLRAGLLDLYLAKQTETLLYRQEAMLEKLVKLLAARLEQGEIPRPEVTQAQIALNQGRLSLQEARKQLAQNRVKLAQALGLPLSALKGIDISFSFLKHPPAPLPSREVARQALLNRPDILAALSEYEAAQSALQLEIARQYPDIHLGPGYNFDDSENKWKFGLSVTLPVYNRNQGPIAEAEARRHEVAARFTALQARVMGEINQALAGYREALRKLKTAEALLAAEKTQEESAQARFKAGETDRLALLSARLVLETANLSRVKAFYQAQQALGLLEDAIKSPLGPSGWIPVALEANREKSDR